LPEIGLVSRAINLVQRQNCQRQNVKEEDHRNVVDRKIGYGAFWHFAGLRLGWKLDYG
jgi:hypothetical protein